MFSSPWQEETSSLKNVLDKLIVYWSRIIMEAISGTPVWTYFSCGDCFWAPGPVEAGMGPGWKAWLGEVVAERVRWGEPWADWEGEAEAERCPPAGGTHKLHVDCSCLSSITMLHPENKETKTETCLLPRLGCVVCGWRDTESLLSQAQAVISARGLKGHRKYIICSGEACQT